MLSLLLVAPPSFAKATGGQVGAPRIVLAQASLRSAFAIITARPASRVSLFSGEIFATRKGEIFVVFLAPPCPCAENIFTPLKITEVLLDCRVPTHPKKKVAATPSSLAGRPRGRLAESYSFLKSLYSLFLAFARIRKAFGRARLTSFCFSFRSSLRWGDPLFAPADLFIPFPVLLGLAHPLAVECFALKIILAPCVRTLDVLAPRFIQNGRNSRGARVCRAAFPKVLGNSIGFLTAALL